MPLEQIFRKVTQSAQLGGGLMGETVADAQREWLDNHENVKRALVCSRSIDAV